MLRRYCSSVFRLRLRSMAGRKEGPKIPFGRLLDWHVRLFGTSVRRPKCSAETAVRKMQEAQIYAHGVGRDQHQVVIIVNPAGQKRILLATCVLNAVRTS